MPCYTSGNIHICAPSPIACSRMIKHCPTCDRRRRMVSEMYEIHGMDVMCCGCGERWQDGEMAERPFSPGWRKRNIAQAKRRWGAYHDRNL